GLLRRHTELAIDRERASEVGRRLQGPAEPEPRLSALLKRIGDEKLRAGGLCRRPRLRGERTCRGVATERDEVFREQHLHDGSVGRRRRERERRAMMIERLLVLAFEERDVAQEAADALLVASIAALPGERQGSLEERCR